MRIRHLLFAALLTVAPPCGLRAAQPNQPQEETELEDKMDVMGAALRKLKRQVNDETQNAASLRLVAALRTAAEEAERLIPAKAADIPDGERVKFITDYRAKMKELLTTLEKLDFALQADKNDEAARLVAKLGLMQKAGHKTFKRPDDN